MLWFNISKFHSITIAENSFRVPQSPHHFSGNVWHRARMLFCISMSCPKYYKEELVQSFVKYQIDIALETHQDCAEVKQKQKMLKNDYFKQQR